MSLPAVVEIEKYGVRVYADPELEAMRPTRCLCLRCTNLAACTAASERLRLCKRHNLAYMVTRCPNFKD